MKNKMVDLHNALFAELEALQDEDSYYNNDGKFDKERAEHVVMRANAVSGVAGQLMELAKIQLEAVKTADRIGLFPKMPETLGIEEYAPAIPLRKDVVR